MGLCLYLVITILSNYILNYLNKKLFKFLKIYMLLTLIICFEKHDFPISVSQRKRIL